VHLRVFQAPADTAPRDGEAWHDAAALAALPMPAPYRKALASLPP
jgi:hypothetical protein